MNTNSNVSDLLVLYMANIILIFEKNYVDHSVDSWSVGWLFRFYGISTI